MIRGAMAQISCEVISVHLEGDHTLFIGKVVGIHVEDHRPLIFYKGKYRGLEPITDSVNQ